MSSSGIKVDKEDVSEVNIEKFSYNWKIKNFEYLHKQFGESVQSPVFTFGSKDEINWQLVLYPNGDTKENENYLSLYLSWEHTSVVKGQFMLSLINNKQEKTMQGKGKLSEKPAKNKEFGFPQFIKREVLLSEPNSLLADGYLIIHCDIFLSSDDISPIIENKKRKLEENSRPSWFKKLFLEDSLSDFKLIAIPSGKILPTHKNVLAACSPVFEAMFKLNMLEQKIDKIKIEAKYEVLKEMLQFIYLGEVEDLKPVVFELVKLADEYQISELIEFCEAALMDHISVDNVLKIITLADSYNMERLKTRALDFGCLHLKEVINSNDFESSVYPQAMQSIIKAFGQQ